jgi:predicted RNA-binding protein with RPS1 domain
VEGAGFVEGQQIDVKVLGKSETGRFRLSRRAVLWRDSSTKQQSVGVSAEGSVSSSPEATSPPVPPNSLFDKLNLKLLTNKDKHQEEKDQKQKEKIEKEENVKKKEKDEEIRNQHQRRLRQF